MSAQEKEAVAWEAKSACKFCPVGATLAGVAIAPMARATSDIRAICPRCSRPATRLIRKHHCISCYNRDREATAGKNAKGTRPGLCDTLHATTLAVGEGPDVTTRRSGTVSGRVEAILALAKSATAAMTFGAAPMEWAA